MLDRLRISYTDCINRNEFIEYPQSILNNPHIINYFDSTQACYIGILAGLSYEKMKTKRVRPSLRIID
jgi:hypothetical protein